MLTLSIYKAITEIRQILGEDAVSTDDEDLKMHGYSEWSSINIDTLPIAVVYPKSTADVSQIAKVAHKYRVPMSMSYFHPVAESESLTGDGKSRQFLILGDQALKAIFQRHMVGSVSILPTWIEF
jgi:hypothetical protein